jgi:exopolysaccharide biosynthesis polyprenyl glycosylphosphotransferase
MKNNASLLYGFFLVVGDFLALVAAFAGAYILRVTLDPRPLIAHVTAVEYIRIFLILLPFWLIIFGLLGLYNKNVYENRFSEFARLLVGSFIGILFVIGYAFISNKPIFPARLVPVYALIISFLFVLLFRTLARAIRRSLFGFGIGINNVLIIGDTEITKELVHAMANTKITGYRVIGIVGGVRHPLHIAYKKHTYASFAEAITKLNGMVIHSIIQTELYPEKPRNSEILTYAQENHIAYRFAPGNSDLFVGNLDVDLFHSVPLIAVHQTALVGWGRIAKRLFDLIFGTVALIVALPFMLIIAILIKILDPGPVFFRQPRLTRFNTLVKIYKFRTHKVGLSGLSDEEAFKKLGKPEWLKIYRENGFQLENDPRISRIGRFLRRTSLDELPQLFNVVKGDISLVGPRALVAEELDQYDKKSLILSVKSGLTGLAQISGVRYMSFEERRKLDLYYVQNWSFWNDIVIMAKTVSVVLFHKGTRQ